MFLFLLLPVLPFRGAARKRRPPLKAERSGRPRGAHLRLRRFPVSLAEYVRECAPGEVSEGETKPRTKRGMKRVRPNSIRDQTRDAMGRPDGCVDLFLPARVEPFLRRTFFVRAPTRIACKYLSNN